MKAMGVRIEQMHLGDVVVTTQDGITKLEQFDETGNSLGVIRVGRKECKTLGLTLEVASCL